MDTAGQPGHERTLLGLPLVAVLPAPLDALHLSLLPDWDD